MKALAFTCGALRNLVGSHDRPRLTVLNACAQASRATRCARSRRRGVRRRATASTRSAAARASPRQQPPQQPSRQLRSCSAATHKPWPPIVYAMAAQRRQRQLQVCPGPPQVCRAGQPVMATGDGEGTALRLDGSRQAAESPRSSQEEQKEGKEYPTPQQPCFRALQRPILLGNSHLYNKCCRAGMGAAEMQLLLYWIPWLQADAARIKAHIDIHAGAGPSAGTAWPMWIAVLAAPLHTPAALLLIDAAPTVSSAASAPQLFWGCGIHSSWLLSCRCMTLDCSCQRPCYVCSKLHVQINIDNFKRAVCGSCELAAGLSCSLEGMARDFCVSSTE